MNFAVPNNSGKLEYVWLTLCQDMEQIYVPHRLHFWRVFRDFYTSYSVHKNPKNVNILFNSYSVVIPLSNLFVTLLSSTPLSSSSSGVPSRYFYWSKSPHLRWISFFKYYKIGSIFNSKTLVLKIACALRWILSPKIIENL